MGWDYPGLSRQRARIAPIVANAPPEPEVGPGYLVAFLRADGAFAAAFFAGLTGNGAAAFAVGALGASPSTDFNGHTLNTRHFWHPTAIATGQIVIRSFQGVNASTEKGSIAHRCVNAAPFPRVRPLT